MKTKLCLALAIAFMASLLVAQTTGDYRTAASGNWNSTATWEYYNGTTWVPATATPTSADGVITVLSSHTVTVTAPVTVDQFIVYGAVVVNSGVTMTIGAGTQADLDLQVYGIVTVDGSLVLSHTGNAYSLVEVYSGGTLLINGTYNVASAGASANTTITNINSGATLEFGPTGLVTGGQQTAGEVRLLTGSTLVVTSASGVNGHFTAYNQDVILICSNDANFVFTGTASGQVTGTFLPVSPITINDLTFDNPNGVSFTNTTNVVNGTFYVTDNSYVGGTNTPAVDGYDSQYIDIAESGTLLSNFVATFSTTAPDDPDYNVDRTWSIVSTTTATKLVTFYWDAADDGSYPWSALDPPAVSINGVLQSTVAWSPSNPRAITISMSTFSATDVITIGRANGQTLPVELSSFTATLYSGFFVRISWVTQSEYNCMGYYLHRASSNQLSEAAIISPLIQGTNTTEQHSYTYVDREIYSTGTYYYWLQMLDYDGSYFYYGPQSIYVYADGDPEVIPGIPIHTEITAAYPNPFNPEINIDYSLVGNANVRIDIFNSRGQLVRNLVDRNLETGNYRVLWNGKGTYGNSLTSGVYLIRMTSGEHTSNRKIILAK